MRRAGRDAQDPRHLIRVDVEQAGFGVECGAAPFAAAVESGEDDGSLRTWGRELVTADDGAEALQRGLVGFRGARGEHVLGENLPRERSGLQRQGLFGGKLFPGHLRRWHGALLEREQWLAGGAFKDPDVARLRDLRDGVHRRVRHREETGLDSRIKYNYIFI